MAKIENMTCHVIYVLKVMWHSSLWNKKFSQVNLGLTLFVITIFLRSKLVLCQQFIYYHGHDNNFHVHVGVFNFPNIDFNALNGVMMFLKSSLILPVLSLVFLMQSLMYLIYFFVCLTSTLMCLISFLMVYFIFLIFYVSIGFIDIPDDIIFLLFYISWPSMKLLAFYL